MVTNEQYLDLVAKVNAARPLYLEGKETGWTDEQYDQMMADIYEYEKVNPAVSDSPTLSVNAGDEGDVKHPVPMLSLRDVFTEEDAIAFFQSHFRKDGSITFSQEYKIDGLSVQLIYEEGTLISASTRGNGYVGVECLDAVRYIADIPKVIDTMTRLIIRGEVYLSKSKFRSYCARYGKQANPRNTAVGIFKRKNELERNEYLSFYAFNLENAAEVGIALGINLNSHKECLSLLQRKGFPTVPSYSVFCPADIRSVIQKTREERDKLDVQIDGMVLKVDQMLTRAELGDNGVIPAWAVAYKFPAKEAETRLVGITFQVGSTGKLTPVANLEPVLVDGSTISKCTLHNRNRIEELGVQINDMVTVYKSGDIIPAIKSVRHTEESTPVIYPEVCPCCGSVLVDDVCMSLDCPEKLKARLNAWVGKGVANIKGISGSLIDALFERKLIKTPDDFYKIQPMHLKLIPKVGDSKVRTFMVGMQESKRTLTFPQIVVGLGVDGLSYAGAEALDKYFETQEQTSIAQKLAYLQIMHVAQFKAVLGNVKGEFVYKQLQNNFYVKLIDNMELLFANR